MVDFAWIYRNWFYATISAFITLIFLDAANRYPDYLENVNFGAAYLGTWLAWFIPAYIMQIVLNANWRVFLRANQIATWLTLVTISGLSAGRTMINIMTAPPDRSPTLHATSVIFALIGFYFGALAVIALAEYAVNLVRRPEEKRKREQMIDFAWEREADTKPVKYVHTNPFYDDLPEAIQRGKQ